ncbi:hypothetical protein PInf_005839 [Phytophthora infestans]|nr:hypothetical protein PInf_005839 [Phytophthora infestans]
MPSSLTTNAAAVEDALLRGQWTQALNDSRSILAARIVQLRQEENPSAMCTEEERLLSVYLQTVFELDLDDEVDTASTIVQAFAPLPSGIALQWTNFLLAMNRRPMATQALREVLASYTKDGAFNFSSEQYSKAAEVLALQLLLPDEGVETARRFVTADGVLDDSAKLQLLRKIQAEHLAAQEATKDAHTSVSNQTATNRSSTVTTEQEVSSQTVSTGLTGAQPRHDMKQDDDSSSYLMIGSTAIALAIAAAGALRYRERIHEAVSNAIPAISKGLADAKYTLFEA